MLTPSQDPAEVQPSEYVVLESGCQSQTPSSPNKAASVIAKKEAYAQLVQKVQKWSVDNYATQPSKNIQHLSMTPSIFRVTVIIDESKGILGTGMGSSLKAAERQAMENLERIIRLFEGSKDKHENCPVKDQSTYKSFEDDNDKLQPWHSMVKNYVDSLSIMHTRQTSLLEECIEWDKRFWVTLKIDGSPPLYGKGVHSTKKKAINFAAITLAHQLDARAADNHGKPIEPPALVGYSDYISKDPEECLKMFWFSSAKVHVHRIINKLFKREAIFDVEVLEKVKPVRYLAKIVYDEQTVGKGQALSSKEAIRLASVDLCHKLWNLNPKLLGPQITTPNKPASEAAPPKEPPTVVKSAEQSRNGSPNKSPVSPDDSKQQQTDQLSNSTPEAEDWKTRPKFAIHEIFLNRTGRTPAYKLEEDKQNGTFTSSVRMETENAFIIGRGRGPNASQASFNAALDFCRKYFSKFSLGEKRSSDEDERAPKAKSLKSAKDPRAKYELMTAISINAEFAIWTFKRFNQIPNMKVSSRGPAHTLIWQCSIPIRIHSKLIEGKAEASSKKNAILSAINDLARLIKDYDNTLHDRFEQSKHQKLPNENRPNNEPSPSVVIPVIEEPKSVEPSKPEVKELYVESTAIIKHPQIPLVVKSDDRSSLMLLCDPRKLKSFEECINERQRSIMSLSRRPSGRPSTPPSEYLIQKSRILVERQAQLYSSSAGQESLRRRQSCPSFKCRERILHALTTSTVVIVDGAVGDGMSSQIPLLILENMISNDVGVSCNILVVVTGRVEAVALADHLADQRGSKIGEEVGFRVGDIDDCEPELYGSILFTTYSAFLRTAKRNPLLIEYSHIILDDISARSLEVDLSLLILREAIAQRPELRLLINSKEDGQKQLALLDNYFARFLKTVVPLPSENNAPPKTVFLEDIVKEFEDTEVATISAKDLDSKLVLEGEKPSGVPFALLEAFIGKLIKSLKPPFTKKGMLVIVPSLNDAQTLKRMLSFGAALKPLEGQNKAIHLLHPNMRHSELMAILSEASSQKSFDLIISTDLIETGFVSCLDIMSVVDCGVRVGPIAGSSYSSLPSAMDSQLQDCEFPGKLMVVDTNSLQRRSRQSNQNHYILAHKRAVEECLVECEAKRITNESLVLRTMAMLGNQVMAFPSVVELLARLPETTFTVSGLEETVQRLHGMSLCFAKSGLLTELGELVSGIPLDPNWGRFLVAAVLMRCLDAGLLICAAVAVGKSPISISMSEDPLDVKKYFSDHHAIISAFNRWQESRPRFLTQSSEQQFCQQNNLDLSCLRQMERVKNRLFDCLEHELRLLSTVAAIYAPNSTDLKDCLNVNLEKRSIVRGLLVYALPENISIGHGVPPLRVLQTKDSLLPIADNSCCYLADYNTETGPGVFVYERVDAAGKAVSVTRVPAMAGALLCMNKSQPTTTAATVPDLSAGQMQAADWIDVNSRDSKLLYTFRQVLHKAMSWLASAATATDAPVPTNDAANEYAVKAVSLAVSLIRNHSNFEQ